MFNPIGSSVPFAVQELEPDRPEDTPFFGDDLKDFTPQIGQELEPHGPRGGEKLPLRGDLLPVRGTQVGSEG